MVTRRLLVCNRLQHESAESTLKDGVAEVAGEAAVAESTGVETAYLTGRRAAIALLALAASASCFLTAESLPIGLLPQI